MPKYVFLKFEAEKKRLEDLGLLIRERVWRGVGEFLRARSLFFYDPSVT